MALGWESEGPGLELRRAPPGSLRPKKKPNHSQPNSVPLVKKITRRKTPLTSLTKNNAHEWV